MAEEKKPTDLASSSGWQLPELSAEELAEISSYFAAHNGGTAKFTPRICPGPSCRMIHDCPLSRSHISLPIGRQCFVELNLIRNYMEGMAQELGLNPADVFAITSVGAIATNSVIIMRALEMLSREDVVVDSFRAMTPDGTPVFERKEHPSIGIIAKMEKINQMIQADLMATRKEKSKDLARKRVSPTEQMQKLKDKLKIAKKAIMDGQNRLAEHYKSKEDGTPEVIDADYTIKEDPDGKVDEEHEGSGGEQEGRKQEERQGEVVRGEAGPSVREQRPKETQALKRDPRGFLIRE